MTEEIIIDVSKCSHKRDDDCMEVPICNEYGGLMGYQSCEAQTLCPYRSQKKIERLEQLKNKYYQQTLDDEITISDLITKCNELEQENRELRKVNEVSIEKITVTAEAKRLQELKQENKSLYEEKNCLHKIIDRLLENAGYSKDIASAEDFEDVYEDMQIKINELAELEQENKELKERFEKRGELMCNCAKQREKYRSVLEEIREIAKFNQFYNPEDLLISGDIGQIQDLKMTEIYNKINEVLE